MKHIPFTEEEEQAALDAIIAERDALRELVAALQRDLTIAQKAARIGLFPSVINRVGHVSVPEDLWADLLAALERLTSPPAHIQAQEYAALRRAYELDAAHREMQYEAGRSTREQIERGGGGQPYN